MSIFHVRAAVERHPELRRILGARRLNKCEHARVIRIDEELLMEQGDFIERQFFVVSNCGELLATRGANLFQSLWQAVCNSARLITALESVGPENIAYVVKFSPGFIATPLNGGISDDPCEITIAYPPKEISLAEMLQVLAKKA